MEAPIEYLDLDDLVYGVAAGDYLTIAKIEEWMTMPWRSDGTKRVGAPTSAFAR